MTGWAGLWIALGLFFWRLCYWRRVDRDSKRIEKRDSKRIGKFKEIVL